MRFVPLSMGCHFLSSALRLVGVSTFDSSLVVCVALLCKDSLAQRFKVNSMTSLTKFKLSGMMMFLYHN